MAAGQLALMVWAQDDVVIIPRIDISAFVF
jgi:hypothetical protein